MLFICFFTVLSARNGLDRCRDHPRTAVFSRHTVFSHGLFLFLAFDSLSVFKIKRYIFPVQVLWVLCPKRVVASIIGIYHPLGAGEWGLGSYQEQQQQPVFGDQQLKRGCVGFLLGHLWPLMGTLLAQTGKFHLNCLCLCIYRLVWIMCNFR